MRNPLFSLLGLIVILFSCSPEVEKSDQSFEKQLQKKLILADSGSIIQIPEGRFAFTRSLSLSGIPDVTIKGMGMNKTTLTFAGQIDGAEGLLIKADAILLEGFTIEDTEGDAIKIQDAHGVTFRDVRTTWTQGAKSSNGGYGIYPVSCTNVLVEGCEASYASDAGIYVGQSTNVVMRNNYAHHNVAGIEIENSRNVEAYNNISEGNTGGFLVFDLPDLPQANGYNVRVFDNIVRENNLKNFAPEGGMVATIPPGTGMLVVSHDKVEIFDNEIYGYKTLGLGVISYFFTERPFKTENGFSPYYSDVYIHNNTFQRKKAIPDLSSEFGKMLNALFPGKPQDIVIDGIFGPDSNLENGEKAICLQNNGSDLRFANLNATDASGLKDLKRLMERNISAFNCENSGADLSENFGEWLDL
jgi:parallel beta-helix repeat protein